MKATNSHSSLIQEAWGAISPPPSNLDYTTLKQRNYHNTTLLLFKLYIAKSEKIVDLQNVRVLWGCLLTAHIKNVAIEHTFVNKNLYPELEYTPFGFEESLDELGNLSLYIENYLTAQSPKYYPSYCLQLGNIIGVLDTQYNFITCE